jgi:hypothetical protein
MNDENNLRLEFVNWMVKDFSFVMNAVLSEWLKPVLAVPHYWDHEIFMCNLFLMYFSILTPFFSSIDIFNSEID